MENRSENRRGEDRRDDPGQNGFTSEIYCGPERRCGLERRSGSDRRFGAGQLNLPLFGASQLSLPFLTLHLER